MASIVAIDARLLQILPSRARLKAARLIAQAGDAERAFQSLIVRQAQLREEIAAVTIEKKQAIARAEAFGQDVVAAAADYDAVLGELAGEVTRLDQQRAKREQYRDDTARLIATLRAFLELQHAANATLMPAAEAKLNGKLNGESPSAAIARIRDEIAGIQRELHALQASPLTKSELKQRARVFVAELGTAGAPTIYAERGAFEPRWLPGSAGGPMAPAGAVTAAWLFPDAMVAALEAQIDQLPGSGVSAVDRPVRERELLDRIAELERAEEALIQASGDDSIVLRRPTASPWAILAVAPARTAS